MKILICGDYVPLNRTIEYNENKNCEKIFNDFSKYITDSNYSIVNLECPVVDKIQKNDKIFKSGPYLKTNLSTIATLSKAGFNVCTLANNHFRDYGDAGVKSTLDACKKENISIVGGGENIEDALKPLILRLSNGDKVGIINICENEFSIASENYGGSNPLDIIENFKQIKSLRNKVRYILIIFHGGNEGYQLPSPYIQKVLRFFIDAGADAIISHHSHCYSGYEIYNNKPIFYGIGNFSFDINNKEKNIWNEGYAIQFDFEKGMNFNVIPYIQGYENVGIRLLKKNEEEIFNKKIIELNNIIIDNGKLQKSFDEFCKIKSGMYLSMINFRNTNRIFAKLNNLGILPNPNKKFLIRLSNLIRCESHRISLLNILK